MKKIYATIIACCAITHFSYAQEWHRSASDTTNIYNLNSGNVGIGTVIPAAKLEINTGGGGAASDGLRVYHSANSGYNVLSIHSEYGTGGGGNLLSISNFDNTKFLINNAGNVGIGTTIPAARLTLQANENNSNGGIKIFGYTHPTDISYWAENQFAMAYNGVFSNVLSSDGTDSYLNVAGGKLGIGTTSPDEKLTVKGKIHAEEVKVNLSVPYPDYVFKPTYLLRSLAEVNKYINKNHHLPEMPTEADVAKNGLNLGETNALLTKKVEELTLYLIEQDKKNKDQQDQINELKLQIIAITKSLTQH